MTHERHTLVAGRSRYGALAALALAALASAANASASGVVELRVALHPGFKRIVFESDAPFQYRLPESATVTGDGFALWLDAASASQTGWVEGDRMPTVRIEPASDGGSDAWVRVEGSVTIESEVLTNPDRLVVDLWDSPRSDPAPARPETDRVTAIRSAAATPGVPAADPDKDRADARALQQPDPAPQQTPPQPAEPRDVTAPIAVQPIDEPQGVVEVEPVAVERGPHDTPPVAARAPARATPTARIWLWLGGALTLLLLLRWLWSRRPVAGESAVTPDFPKSEEPQAGTLESSARETPAPEVSLRAAPIDEAQPEPSPTEATPEEDLSMTPILHEATPEKDLSSEASGSESQARCPAEQTSGGESHDATRREADATFVSDMVQMLRRIDGRLALLESKLRGIESRERDAASSREADRVEIEVHRAALARFQHLVGRNGRDGRSG